MHLDSNPKETLLNFLHIDVRVKLVHEMSLQNSVSAIVRKKIQTMWSKGAGGPETKVKSFQGGEPLELFRLNLHHQVYVRLVRSFYASQMNTEVQGYQKDIRDNSTRGILDLLELMPIPWE